MIDIEKEKETLRNLRRDIIREKKSMAENVDIAPDTEKRIEIEFMLKFLIDQLLHYLSILKK
jgi:ribosome recycling factor